MCLASVSCSVGENLTCYFKYPLYALIIEVCDVCHVFVIEMAGSTRFVREISKIFLPGVQCLTYFRAELYFGDKST